MTNSNRLLAVKVALILILSGLPIHARAVDKGPEMPSVYMNGRAAEAKAIQQMDWKPIFIYLWKQMKEKEQQIAAKFSQKSDKSVSESSFQWVGDQKAGNGMYPKANDAR